MAEYVPHETESMPDRALLNVSKGGIWERRGWR